MKSLETLPISRIARRFWFTEDEEVTAELSLLGTLVRAAPEYADATAADAMSGFVFALPADATIEHAAALMAHESVGQVIVTGTTGELIGMVSALDIARHCAVRAGFLAA